MGRLQERVEEDGQFVAEIPEGFGSSGNHEY